MRLAGAVLLAALMWTATANAQADMACAFDVQKFCSDVKAGGGRIMKCLQAHAADVSPGCKEALGKGQGAAKPMGGWFKSCEGDVGKLCKDVPAGKGRIAECLNSHTDQLSPVCKTALQNRPNAPGAAQAAAAATPAATPAATAKKKK